MKGETCSSETSVHIELHGAMTQKMKTFKYILAPLKIKIIPQSSILIPSNSPEAFYYILL
jgi:hypothetical protein